MLTHEELERRRGFITATDVPAILGQSPWRNAADVWFSKTQKIEQPPNDSMAAGSLLEPSVLAWAAQQLGPLHPGDWRVGDNGINAASLDATTATGEVVEAKTSGITGRGMPADWGDNGTDEIPVYYLLQVQTQLMVTGQRVAWVPALIGGRGFVMFRVEASPSLHEVIAEESEAFWLNHVKAEVCPDNVRPNFDTMKHLQRVAGKSVQIADELAKAYLQAAEDAKAAAKLEEESKAALLAAIGDAEACKWSGGEFSYKTQTRKGYAVAEATFRVLRHKIPKVKSSARVVPEMEAVAH